MFDWDTFAGTWYFVFGVWFIACLAVLGPPAVVTYLAELENKRRAQRYREQREQALRDHAMRAVLFHNRNETAVNPPVANSQVSPHNPGRRRLLPLND